MFKKLDNLLASLSSTKAVKLLHVDNYTEDLIANTPGELIAESDEGQLFVGIQEISGYYFLETTLLSPIGIKTFKGGTLHFSGGKSDFDIKSDTQEIKSEYSNVSRRFMTDISFGIEPEEINRIVKGDFTQLQFSFKKKHITLSKVQGKGFQFHEK